MISEMVPTEGIQFHVRTHPDFVLEYVELSEKTRAVFNLSLDTIVNGIERPLLHSLRDMEDELIKEFEAAPRNEYTAEEYGEIVARFVLTYYQTLLQSRRDLIETAIYCTQLFRESLTLRLPS